MTVAEGFLHAERLAFLKLLQWGRNLTVAEGTYAIQGNDTIDILQWGRNLTVAEGSIRYLCGGIGADFNGAAT